jgi:succinyl-CoA synthetase alpha subunit
MCILVNQDTRVLVQGITGREASTFTKGMLDYGTAVVAGVTPGKGGQTLFGVPVFNTVRKAVESTRPNTAVVSVPPAVTKDAVIEAIDGGIKLVNVFTERVPRADVVEMIFFAKQHDARIIGPNSLGIISPGKGKVGAIGGPAEETARAYIPGPVAVLSRSGGMCTETCSLLTVNGVGQSTAINIGGDPIVGSSFVNLLPLLERDEETQVVVLFCEPGTGQEESMAQYVKERGFTKPIVAFVAGAFVDELPETRFGHAAVIVHGDRGSVRGKQKAMRAAGITVVEAHSEIISAVRKHLDQVRGNGHGNVH